MVRRGVIAYVRSNFAQDVSDDALELAAGGAQGGTRDNRGGKTMDPGVWGC